MYKSRFECIDNTHKAPFKCRDNIQVYTQDMRVERGLWEEEGVEKKGEEEGIAEYM